MPAMCRWLRSRPIAPAAAGDFDIDAVTAEVKAALEAMKADTDAKLSAGEISAKWMHATAEGSREMLDLATKMGSAKQRLDQACTDKFGKGLEGLVAESKTPSVKNNPMFGMLSQLAGQMSSQLSDVDPAGAEIAPASATEAVVSMSGTPQPVKMIKVDGAWKVDMDSLMGGPQSAQVLAMARGPLTAFSTVFETVTGKINADAYSDAEAMLLGLSAELMAAMQKLRPVECRAAGALRRAVVDSRAGGD